MNNKRIISLVMCFVVLIVGRSSVRSFAESPSETNVNAEQHFEKANELYDAADYGGAVGEYEKVITISPNGKISQNARYWIGQSHFAAGEFDAALAAFQGLASEYPTSAIIPATQVMIGRVEQSKEEKSLVEAIKNGELEQLKSLISKGVDVNAKVKAEVATHSGDATYVEEGWTLLNLAIRHRNADVATFLINKGADVNGRDGFELHKTALHWVAHFGTASLADLLIAKGADVNVREDGGWTPLHNVSSDNNLDRKDQLEVARLLISNGADIDALTKGHVTPLLYAARNGRVDMVELFLSKGADIETPDSHGVTPLIAAALAGSTETVKLLLDRGANVEARLKPKRTTALHYAAAGNRLEIVKLLLEAGAYIDDRDIYDLTPLYHAVMHGRQEMVDLLLDNGAGWRRRCLDIGLIAYAMGNNQGEMIKFLINKGIPHSPVHVAAFLGDIDEVKSYLAGGGYINAVCPDGLTLLMCAITGGQTEVAELLINKGANTNQKDTGGRTALEYALRKGRTEIARTLLDNHAEATAVALKSAVNTAQKDIVEMLIVAGADVNGMQFEKELNNRLPFAPDYKFDRDWTLLHHACYQTNQWKNREACQAIVEVLVAHGADVNARTKNGRTPMSLLKLSANHSYNEKLIELLRKHGAKE